MVFGFLKRKAGKATLKGAMLPELVKPSYVENEFDCIKVNNQLNRIITAVGYPRIIREGWLNAIVSSEGDFDLSMFIEPASIEFVLTQLNRELVKQRCDMMMAEQKGIVNPSLKVQYDDTYNTLARLQAGEEKLFNFSLYVNARAQTKEKLELLSRKIESELNSIMVIPKTPYMKMQPAMQSILPLGQDKLRIQRNIPSNALAACFPFTSSFLNMQDGGIMFGLNRDNNIPIILDVYKMQNYNGLVLGTSGGGKSFFVKLYILRSLLRNVKTMIIDPQGEYVELCKTYGGQLVEISQESKTIINPLDLLDRDFGDKMLSLMDLFKIMCGDLSEVQKNILDRALIKVYAEKGIKPKQPKTWKKQPPILRDLYKALKEEKKHASRIERTTYDALLNRLHIYAEGSFSFMNKQTNLDLGRKLICFNIVNMPAQVKPVMMYLILDFVHKKIQQDRERKLLVIDEAWTLLRYGEHAQYLFEIIKTARKFGLGMVILTQEVNDLLTSKRAGTAILANTAWKLLLKQEPTVIREVVEKFNLNREEQNFILTADTGEGMLLAMNDHIPLRVTASEKEYEVITTNPDELRAKEEKRQQVDVGERQKMDTQVFNLEKNYFLKTSLNKKQIAFLKKKGYVETKFVGLEGRGPKTWLVKKPETKESILHYFYVQAIADELRKHTENVVLYSSYGPDICFQTPQGIIALEIETGKSFKKKEKQIEEKAKKNNKQFKRWFFVLTAENLRKDYEKYGNVFGRSEIKKVLDKMFQNKR